MMVLEGKSVFGGIAIGPIGFFEKGEDQVKRYSVEDTGKEKKRFEEAKDTAKAVRSLSPYATDTRQHDSSSMDSNASSRPVRRNIKRQLSS